MNLSHTHCNIDNDTAQSKREGRIMEPFIFNEDWYEGFAEGYDEGYNNALKELNKHLEKIIFDGGGL